MDTRAYICSPPRLHAYYLNAPSHKVLITNVITSHKIGIWKAYLSRLHRISISNDAVMWKILLERPISADDFFLFWLECKFNIKMTKYFAHWGLTSPYFVFSLSATSWQAWNSDNAVIIFHLQHILRQKFHIATCLPPLEKTINITFFKKSINFLCPG